MDRKVYLIAVGLVVLAALVVLLVAISYSTTTGTNVLNFQLTDPPQVPSGTSALVITYSSVKAYIMNKTNGTGEWISGSGSGTVNLMSLINSSQIIGSVNITPNSSVSMVSFMVTSARIIINGTTYNVTIPNSQITSSVTGSESVNSSSSVLIDLSPSIVTIVTDNSTVFVMVPSVKAVMVGSHKLVGTQSIRQFEQGSLGISSISMSSSGSNTTLSLSVTNNGNETVDIKQIFLYGNFSVLVIPRASPSGISANSSGNFGSGRRMDVNDVALVNGIQIAWGKRLNVNSQFGINGSVESMVHTGAFFRNMHVVNFVVGSSGQLSFPSGSGGFVSGSGYALTPGSSVTLTFSGDITTNNGYLVISGMPGDVYRVFVTGSSGSSTSGNVTAA